MSRRTGLVVITIVFLGMSAFILSKRGQRPSIAINSAFTSSAENHRPSSQMVRLGQTNDRSPASSSPFDASSLSEDQIQEISRADSVQREAEVKAREVRLQKLDLLAKDPKALRFQSAERELIALPRVFALNGDQAKLLSSDYSFWQARNGYSFFEKKSAAVSNPDGAFPVVRVAGTEMVAVLTGAFSVKSRTLSGVEELSQRFKLSFIQSFEALQLSYLQSEKRTAEELVAILNQLRNDPRVESADLEMVDRIYVAR